MQPVPTAPLTLTELAVRLQPRPPSWWGAGGTDGSGIISDREADEPTLSLSLKLVSRIWSPYIVFA